MPYRQRAARQWRRHLISYADVCRANRAVTRELDKLGLWHRRLDAITVYWVPASLGCYGWHQDDIYIPAVSGIQLLDLIRSDFTSLADVLRYEWAHAVADKWPHLINTKRFVQTFGGDYDSIESPRPYCPAHHVTRYAATMPGEDFAEVFHFFLRHRGRLPTRMAKKPHLVAKWWFIKWLASRISGRNPLPQRVRIS
jgi:hypothetical protein